MTVSTVGILMPQDFPEREYEKVHRLVIKRNAKAPINSIVLTQFLGGWNAVAYRFRATAEHDEAFTQALSKEADAQAAIDTALAFESKHLQERELFGFFVTGFSVLESIAYSVFALCSMMNASAFPMLTAQDRRRVSLKETESRLATNFPNEEISSVFQTVISSPEFQEWKDVRNTLAHRTSPPRLYRQTVSIGAPNTGVTSWEAEWLDFGISLDACTTANRRTWLAKMARDLLNAANDFGRSHL